MVIRRAATNEIDTILSKKTEVLKEATAGYAETAPEKADQILLPFFSSGGYYLVSVQDDIIQGWIGIGVSYDMYLGQEVGFLSEIYVYPKYRGQGIAKQLCKEAVYRLKKEGYKIVQLQVFAGNPANKLAGYLGFKDAITMMQLDLDELNI